MNSKKKEIDDYRSGKERKHEEGVNQQINEKRRKHKEEKRFTEKKIRKEETNGRRLEFCRRDLTSPHKSDYSNSLIETNNIAFVLYQTVLDG